MRKIIFTRQDGGLSVVHPVRNTRGETLSTDAEIEQRAWDKLPKDAINPQFIDASAIPVDRSQREAWVHGGDKVTVDTTKVRPPTPKQETVADLKAALVAEGLLTQAKIDAAVVTLKAAPR